MTARRSCPRGPAWKGAQAVGLIGAALGQPVAGPTLREVGGQAALGESVLGAALREVGGQAALGESVVCAALGQSVVGDALREVGGQVALGESVVGAALRESVVGAALREAVACPALRERLPNWACVVLGTALGQAVALRRGRISSLGERLRAGSPVVGRAGGDRAASRRIVAGGGVLLRQLAARGGLGSLKEGAAALRGL